MQHRRLTPLPDGGKKNAQRRIQGYVCFQHGRSHAIRGMRECEEADCPTEIVIDLSEDLLKAKSC
jgi:hypothetical protein